MILSSPVDVSVPTVSLTHTYPPVIKHGNWKSHKNTKLSIGNSSIDFRDFPAERKMHQSKPWRFHQPTIQRTRIWIKRMPGRGTGDLAWNRLTKNDGRRYKWSHPTRKQGSTKIPVTKELKMKSTETLTLLKWSTTFTHPQIGSQTSIWPFHQPRFMVNIDAVSRKNQSE